MLNNSSEDFSVQLSSAHLTWPVCERRRETEVDPFCTVQGRAIWYPVAFCAWFQKHKLGNISEVLQHCCATVPPWLGNAQKSQSGPAPLEKANICHLWDSYPKPHFSILAAAGLAGAPVPVLPTSSSVISGKIRQRPSNQKGSI